MMTKEGSTKSVNLLIPGAGVFVVGSWRGGATRREGLKLHVCIILMTCVNIKYIDCHFRDYNAAFLCHY